jgi:hypothetical protein
MLANRNSKNLKSNQLENKAFRFEISAVWIKILNLYVLVLSNQKLHLWGAGFELVMYFALKFNGICRTHPHLNTVGRVTWGCSTLARTFIFFLGISEFMCKDTNAPITFFLVEED